jgi:hypothetical protein
MTAIRPRRPHKPCRGRYGFFSPIRRFHLTAEKAGFTLGSREVTRTALCDWLEENGHTYGADIRKAVQSEIPF